MKGFKVDTSANDKYFIVFDGYAALPETLPYTSSYLLLQARLLGLSYPDYLRFCQSKGGKLKGKTGYTIVLWEDKKQCQEVCNLIEKEWQKLIKMISFL